MSAVKMRKYIAPKIHLGHTKSNYSDIFMSYSRLRVTRYDLVQQPVHIVPK